MKLKDMKEEIKIIKDLLELVEELYKTGDNSHWKLEEEETVINADKYLLKKGLEDER